MPEVLTRRATALAYGQTGWTPPVARPAATVVLVRSAPAGLQAYLMRRVSTMAFAAGMHVFPGGRVDERDADPDLPWATPDGWDQAAQAARASADPALARALVVCAVRETFEECGVLLVRSVADGSVAAVPSGGGPAWEADRADVLAGRVSLADVLRRRGLAIDPGLVPLWSHWVTPEVEDRRYDVRFYLAALPAGQDAHDVSGEADRVRWLTPQQALTAYQAGRMAMLPPTAATLAELAAAGTVEVACQQAPQRLVQPVLPRALPDGRGGVSWVLADARTGQVLAGTDGEPPAGSESLGIHA